MFKAVHQYVSTIARRDAIGEYAFFLKKAFRQMGYESEIFHDSCSEEVRGDTIPFKHYKRFSASDNLFIIHYGIKLPYLESLISLLDKKILVYHNITPGDFFKIFAPWMVKTCDESRLEVYNLKDHVIAAVGDSDYNSKELVSMDYKNVRTIPLSIDFSKYEINPDPETLKVYSVGNWVNWLFVGRVIPNKKQEDLIKSFYYYQKYINKQSRLFLVGHGSGMSAYVKYLKRFSTHLGLRNVIFTGSVPQSTLAAYYKIADLFIAMSEHEGFCVPLLEAFYYKIPVIAYNSSAVSETLGGAGVLIKKKEPSQTASLAEYILRNPKVKADIIESQSKRLKTFEKDPVLEKWKNLLDSLQPRELPYTPLEPDKSINTSLSLKDLNKKPPVSNKHEDQESKPFSLTLAKPETQLKEVPPNPDESEVDVESIVDSIKIEAYLNDFDGFEKRLRQIRERHEFLNLPNLAIEYSSLFGIWPLRPLAAFGTKVFRKLYIWHSKNQRDAVDQLMNEVKILYFALRYLRKVHEPGKKKTNVPKT